jgi:TonB family protein
VRRVLVLPFKVGDALPEHADEQRAALAQALRDSCGFDVVAPAEVELPRTTRDEIAIGRDPARTLARIEEVVRAVLWFHPCVWWLLGQIQLTREQAVDREVIDITASREQYIDALLAVAGGRPQLDLAPAPLFLQKSHLSQRVALLLKGASMSKQRLLSSLAAICGALVVTARLAVFYFPISAPAQEIIRGETNLLHRVPLEYPADAIAKGIQGTVVVAATLNERGVVSDARILSGPEPLRKAALKSVLEWHYTGQAQSPVEVAIDFKLPARQPGVGGTVSAARRSSTSCPPRGKSSRPACSATSTVCPRSKSASPAAATCKAKRLSKATRS